MAVGEITAASNIPGNVDSSLLQKSSIIHSMSTFVSTLPISIFISISIIPTLSIPTPFSCGSRFQASDTRLLYLFLKQNIKDLNDIAGKVDLQISFKEIEFMIYAKSTPKYMKGSSI